MPGIRGAGAGLGEPGKGQHKGDLGGDGIALCIGCDGGYTCDQTMPSSTQSHIAPMSISWF